MLILLPANFFALMYFIFAIANMLSYLVIGFAGTHVSLRTPLPKPLLIKVGRTRYHS